MRLLEVRARESHGKDVLATAMQLGNQITQARRRLGGVRRFIGNRMCTRL